MFDKKIVRSAIPRLEKRTARSEVSSEQGRSKSAGLDSLEAVAVAKQRRCAESARPHSAVKKSGNFIQLLIIRVMPKAS